MFTVPRRYIPPEEYLELERKADVKLEYFAGEMFAMAGGSKAHALIASNIIRELGVRLKDKPCNVYSSDVCVHVPAKFPASGQSPT